MYRVGSNRPYNGIDDVTVVVPKVSTDLVEVYHEMDRAYRSYTCVIRGKLSIRDHELPLALARLRREGEGSKWSWDW